MQYSPTEFLKITNITADHFGFRTIESLKTEPMCRNCNTSLPHTISPKDKKIDSENGLLTDAVPLFCEQNLHALDSPVLLYSLEQKPNSSDTVATFNIFNVPKSIAEAILIQLSRALMNELGQTEHMVRINSLGDNESCTRYSRELANFLRKRIETIPETTRELLKEHPLFALSDLIKKDHELAYKCPNPLEYLSDQSRKHFREIVEFLDMTETPYEIDPKMIAHHDCYSDALFSIESTAEVSPDEISSISIRGGRYDEYLYQKTRSRIPAVGAVIKYSNSKPPQRIPRAKKAKPSVYVIQLGFGAKIRSLMIVDELRQLGIPVQHDLSSDSLSSQLRDAEAREIPYTIIIGQKEFIEQTVILRDMKGRNQEYLAPAQMLKKLKRQLATA
jgi:histidyl-tRNA synthetase